MFSLRSVTLLLGTFSAFLTFTPRQSQAHLDVWVDPGHGDHDPGNVGVDGDAEPNEDNINLDVCQFLEGDLLGLGMISKLTRNTDSTFFPLEQRPEIANGTRANDQGFMDTCDLFISVHMNSWGVSTVLGTETYYAAIKVPARLDTAYVEDKRAADTIHPDVVANANVAFLGCSNDRHVKRENFAVLRLSEPPAVLIEVCFLSNACQFNNIVTSGDQALISDGIAAGASSFIFAPKRTGVPFAAEPLDPQLPIASCASTAGIRGAVLQEGFEGVMFPPIGWSTLTSGAPLPHRWHRSTHADYIANGVASAVVGGEHPSAINEWLISPPVALAATDDAIAFLWAGNRLYAGNVNATCSVRQSGTTTWTQLWSLVSEPQSDPFIYRERVVDLSGWTGMTVEFGFNVVGTNGADFELDDIIVGDFDPTTTPANNLCANASVLPSSFNIAASTCYAGNELDPYIAEAGACVANPLGGADIFYELDVAAGDTLVAACTAEWGMGFYVVDDCVSGTCLTGAYQEDGSSLPEILYEFPAAGTYYLVIDGESGSCGPFQLEGEIRPTAVGVIESPRPSDELSLSAAPNPSARGMLIRGHLKAESDGVASVEIYDIAGKEIRTVSVPLSGRDFVYEWDGRNSEGVRAGAGTYFIRVQAGSDVLERKVTLLR